MTWPPLLEAGLVAAGQGVLAWAATYLVHSTLAIAGTWTLDRTVRLAGSDRTRVWRAALLLPILTSALQTVGLSAGPAPALDVAAVPWSWLGDATTSLAIVLAISGVTVIAAGALALGHWRLRHRFGRRQRLSGTAQAELVRMAAAFGRRPPVLTTSDRITVPAAIGRREICVPASLFVSMPSDQQRALLAHELGHLVRRDPLWIGAAAAVARALPFQPLNRVVVRRLRDAAEHAADEFAVRITSDPVALARALTALCATVVLFTTAAAATGSPIVRRVHRLLEPPVHVRRRSRTACVAAVGLAAVTLLALAPGVRWDPDRAANRLAWLAPSREEPNARMLTVRRELRHWRDTWR